MRRRTVIQLSAERSTRSAGSDTARPQRFFQVDAGRPKRIDHYIDYFGSGAGATPLSHRIRALDRR